MKKFALLLVIAVLLLPPALVKAQQPLKISNLDIELWPEYDRANVLVITHLILDPSVSLPAEVAMRVPLGAEIFAVAVRDMDGQLLNVNHTEETSGSWQIVRMQVALAEVRVEYYDGSLKFNGSERSFVYQWPGDFQVARAGVILQQPVDSSEVKINPGPVTSQVNAVDGLTYFSKEVGSLNAGQSFELEIGYQKSTDRLSVEAMTVAPSEPLPSEVTKENSNNIWLTIVLGVVGLLLICGGIFWFWKSSQQETAPRRRSRGRASARTGEASQGAGDGVYCQQCGRRAAAGDRFCRSCGSRLRLE